MNKMAAIYQEKMNKRSMLAFSAFSAVFFFIILSFFRLFYTNITNCGYTECLLKMYLWGSWRDGSIVRSTCYSTENKCLASTRPLTTVCNSSPRPLCLLFFLGSVLQFLLSFLPLPLMGLLWVCSPASIASWTNTWLPTPTSESPPSCPLLIILSSLNLGQLFLSLRWTIVKMPHVFSASSFFPFTHHTC